MSFGKITQTLSKQEQRKVWEIAEGRLAEQAQFIMDGGMKRYANAMDWLVQLSYMVRAEDKEAFLKIVNENECMNLEKIMSLAELGACFMIAELTKKYHLEAARQRESN